MLVVDASAALNACIAKDGFAHYRREQLVAPPLLWPEVRSVLHESAWRREIPSDLARIGLERLRAAPIGSRAPAELGPEAWRVADALGWAKTYDAEYLALAALLRCRLVTVDEALIRGTTHLGYVIRPSAV